MCLRGSRPQTKPARAVNLSDSKVKAMRRLPAFHSPSHIFTSPLIKDYMLANITDLVSQQSDPDIYTSAVELLYEALG